MKKTLLILALFVCLLKVHAQEPTLKHHKLTVEEIEAIVGKKIDFEDWFHGEYYFIAENFPPNKKYKFYTKNLNHKPMYVGGCFTDDTGKMWMRLTKSEDIKEFSNHLFSYGNFLPGEPVEFTLIPRDKASTTTYTHTLFPNPLEVEDQQGRKVAMRIITPNLESFGVELTNFQPNEKIKIISISGNEKIQKELVVSKYGTLTHMIHPAVVGKKRGEATYTVIPLASEKPITLNYQWGLLD